MRHRTYVVAGSGRNGNRRYQCRWRKRHATRSRSTASAGLSSARQQAQEPEPYTFPDDEPVVTPENAVETARYISEMTMELARMASSAGLETTCYLLTMARVEAEAAIRGRAPGLDAD